MSLDQPSVDRASLDGAGPARASLRGVAGWLVVAAALVLAAFVVLAPEDALARTIVVLLVTACLAAWIAWQDLRTYTIPDAGVLAIAILAVAGRWSVAAQAGDVPLATLLAVGLDAALPGGVLLAFREIYYRRRGFDGLGLGDVKLAAAGGLLVGTVGFCWALFAASALGLVFVGIVTRLSPKSHARDFVGSGKLAFGAILAPAVWVVCVAQQIAPAAMPGLW